MGVVGCCVLKCRKPYCKYVIVSLQAMLDGVHKHFHPHPIFILHTKFELLAEKMRRVLKTRRCVAVPMMMSVSTGSHWCSIKRIEFGSQLRRNAEFVLNVA